MEVTPAGVDGSAQTGIADRLVSQNVDPAPQQFLELIGQADEVAGSRGLHGGGKGNDEIEVAARRTEAPVGRRTADLEPLDAMLAAQPRDTCAASQLAPEQFAHLGRTHDVEEEVGLAVTQALMDEAAADGQRVPPPGHEAGHDAVLLADFTGAGLEQDGAIGLFQRGAEGDGDFGDAGPGSGVQTFDGHAEDGHVVHQRIEEVAPVGHAQE